MSNMIDDLKIREFHSLDYQVRNCSDTFTTRTLTVLRSK